MRIICARGICTTSDKHTLAGLPVTNLQLRSNLNAKLILNQYKILSKSQ